MKAVHFGTCRGYKQAPSCVRIGRTLRTVRKLVHIKRILVNFCVVSTHDATLKIEAVLSLFHDGRNQLNFKQQNFFACHTKKAVAVTCPLVCADLKGVI